MSSTDTDGVTGRGNFPLFSLVLSSYSAERNCTHNGALHDLYMVEVRCDRNVPQRTATYRNACIRCGAHCHSHTIKRRTTAKSKAQRTHASAEEGAIKHAAYDHLLRRESACAFKPIHTVATGFGGDEYQIWVNSDQQQTRCHVDTMPQRV